MSGRLKSPGEWVWVPDKADCFVPCKVVDGYTEGEAGTVETEDGRMLKLTAKETATCLDMDLMSLQNVENMVLFNDLNEASLLHNVRKRYNGDSIYTNVGDILVSLNPFKALPIYSGAVMGSYISAQGQGMPPHIFTVADVAYRSMIAERRSQAVCIAGESGAGKTEAMKSVLRYLAEVSSRTAGGSKTADHASKKNIEERILQTNPVTEAFGNAKTLRNNNSSRFGKWTALRFSKTGSIRGAFITDYLLEKSRVVFQAEGERSYHAFYQLLAGAAQPERRELAASLKLGRADAFSYLLTPAGVTECVGMDDTAEFELLVAAFTTLDMSPEQQNAIFRTLAAILHMGNLEYREDDGGTEDALVVANADVLAHACGLLGLELGKLTTSLTSRNIGRASIIAVPYNGKQARQARDALCKALYGELFKWLIAAVNRSLTRSVGEGMAGDAAAAAAAAAASEDATRIGMLDIFGFETFETNSFEQLCINYCNEKLQSHFNNHIFMVEQRAYEAEGVSVSEIEFDNNDVTLALLEGRGGVIEMMDEEILVPKGSDEGFLSKLVTRHEKHARFTRIVKVRSTFGVKHYAGDVSYDVTGFLEKNKDTLQVEFIALTKASSDAFVASLFQENAKKAEGAAAGAEGGGGRRPPPRRKRGGANHKTTLATMFKTQLASLVTIMEECAPQFVRCVKPNHAKVGNVFESRMVLSQLRCAGLLEVCRVRKLGYPCRFAFDQFIQRYHPVAPADQGEVRSFCAALEAKGALQAKQYQVGHSKVFLRVACANHLEQARRDALFEHVQNIQKRGRGIGCRQRFGRFAAVLVDLAAAVASCDEETIGAALECCAILPFGGTNNAAVQQARKVQAILITNRPLMRALESGEVDAKDESLLKGLIESFESVGMTGEALENARSFVEGVQHRREALLAVQEAMAAEIPEIDVGPLNAKCEALMAAVAKAEEVRVREGDLAAAQEMVQLLVDQRECLRDITHAMEAKDVQVRPLAVY